MARIRYNWCRVLNNSTSIKSVNITSAEQLASLDDIVSRMSISSAVKTRLDLSHRLNLDFLYIEDDRVIDYQLLPKNLTTLMIGKYRQKDLRPIENLSNLNSLRLIFYESETLEGIGKLQKLKYLKIQEANKLTNITDLAKLVNLRVLIFEDAIELKNIEPISQLTKLLCLGLPDDKQNCYQSIKFLENFAELGLVFWNKATIMDGKVKFLLDLPAIFDVTFTEPSNVTYDFSKEELKVALKKHKLKRQMSYYSLLSAEGGQAAKMAENYMNAHEAQSGSLSKSSPNILKLFKKKTSK